MRRGSDKISLEGTPSSEWQGLPPFAFGKRLARDARRRGREQGDAMPQRREPADQRDHHALRATVPLRRQRLVGGDDDVHSSGQ